MLRTSRVILHLAPGLLDAALVSRSGEVLHFERAVLDAGGWQEAWESGLTALDDALAGVLARVPGGARGRTVTVVYTSPSVITLLSSEEVGGERALGAVRTRLHEHFSDEPSALVHRETVLGERRGTRTDVLASCDRDETLQALYGWLLRGGVKLDGAVPSKTLAIVDAYEGLARAGGPASTLRCHLTERSLVIAAGEGGDLGFARVVDFGACAIADAYARGLGGDEGRVTPDARGAADELLYSEGIPSLSDRGGETDFDQTGVVRALQPVLQRLFVEIKQTLRFGLPPGWAPIERVVLSGCGGAIPGLAEILSESLDIAVEAEPSGVATGPGGRVITSPAAATASRRTAPITLRPAAASQAMVLRGLTRSLLAGAACAVAVIGAEVFFLHEARTGLAHQIAETAPAIERIRSRTERNAEAVSLATLIGRAEAFNRELAGPAPVWGGVLGEVAVSGAGLVDLHELRLRHEHDGPALEIAGLVGASGEAELSSFVDHLAGSSLTARVRVASTRRGTGSTHFTVRYSPALVDRFEAVAGVGG